MQLRDILRECLRLDLIDLSYEYSSEKLGNLNTTEDALPRSGVLSRLGSFAKQFVASLRQPRDRSVRIAEGAVLFFAMSPHELDVLAPVQENVPGSWVSGNQSRAVNDLSLPLAYLLSLPFFPLVLLKMWSSNGYERRSFRCIFDHYWLTYGLYIVAVRWLQRIRPAALVVANQVNTRQRVVVKAAHDLRIPTIFIPHATTPYNFPPLHYTYALLDGEDAAAKYAEAGGSHTRCFLVGNPKLDSAFRRLNRNPTVEVLGICTNGMDPLPRIEELAAALRSKFPELEIVIRPHPADRRMPAVRAIAEKYRLEFSNARQEPAAEFLAGMDAIIAGDSNILVEAAINNVVPLYYDYAKCRWDWYGFVKNGLVEYRETAASICDAVESLRRHKPDIRHRAKPYCATIGTLNDGRAAEFAGNVIVGLTGAGASRALADLETVGVKVPAAMKPGCESSAERSRIGSPTTP